MGLKEQLMDDYKDAMKKGEKIRKDTVNQVRAAIKQHEIDQQKVIEDEKEIVQIIKKQVKMRTDAIADFAKGGRDDLVKAYEEEVEVLKAYLPEEMSLEDIKASIKKIAEDTGIEKGMQNMGALMKEAMKELKDKADGSAVNQAVKDFLNGLDD